MSLLEITMQVFDNILDVSKSIISPNIQLVQSCIQYGLSSLVALLPIVLNHFLNLGGLWPDLYLGGCLFKELG